MCTVVGVLQLVCVLQSICGCVCCSQCTAIGVCTVVSVCTAVSVCVYCGQCMCVHVCVLQSVCLGPIQAHPEWVTTAGQHLGLQCGLCPLRLLAHAEVSAAASRLLLSPMLAQLKVMGCPVCCSCTSNCSIDIPRKVE